jgi:hypothetical protein
MTRELSLLSTTVQDAFQVRGESSTVVQRPPERVVRANQGVTGVAQVFLNRNPIR